MAQIEGIRDHGKLSKSFRGGISSGGRDGPQQNSNQGLADASMSAEQIIPVGLTEEVRVAPSSALYLQNIIPVGLAAEKGVAPSSVPVHLEHPEVPVRPVHPKVPVRPVHPEN